MKKLKRVFAFVICAVMLFSTAACSLSQNSAVNVSGAEIDYETFLYFLDTVKSSPEDYGLKEKETDSSKLTDAAIELCKEYVVVNTWLSEAEITLSSSEKSAASDRLNNIWQVYSDYYEKLGISKQVLMKIMTAEANKDRLFYYVFDEGGEKTVAEEDIKAFYEENYVSFRAVSVYLNNTDKDGNAVSMTDEEKEAVKTELEVLGGKFENGQSMSEVVEQYSIQHPDSTVSDQLQFIKKGAHSYPEGFFEQVKELESGDHTVLMFDDYAFLVAIEKADSDNAQQYYARYRDDCLKSMRSGEFEALVKAYASALEANPEEKMMNKALKEVGIDV